MSSMQFSTYYIHHHLAITPCSPLLFTSLDLLLQILREVFILVEHAQNLLQKGEVFILFWFVRIASPPCTCSRWWAAWPWWQSSWRTPSRSPPPSSQPIIKQSQNILWSSSYFLPFWMHMEGLERQHLIYVVSDSRYSNILGSESHSYCVNNYVYELKILKWYQWKIWRCLRQSWLDPWSPLLPPPQGPLSGPEKHPFPPQNVTSSLSRANNSIVWHR